MITTLMPCAVGALRLHIDGFIFSAVMAYVIFALPFVVVIGLFYDYVGTMRLLQRLDRWGRTVLARKVGL